MPDESGARDDGGPYYSSAGTQDLQVHDASLLFLYDGPNGLSLVVVHGAVGPSPEGGGSATFAFTGLPSGGEWVVEDDLYLDPETGQRASTNYDRWNVGGTNQTISWTWGDGGTDGGAFRGLGGDFAVGIDPAFNEAATRLEYNYEGRVTEWQVLSGGSTAPDRYSLALDQPVTIQTGRCEGEASTGEQRETRRAKHEKQQRKHERKGRKHERKQQKHDRKRERKKAKHERKERKHERKRQKHEKD